MKVVLTGSTGLVGGALVQRLLEDRSISQLTVIARRNIEEPNPKLNQVIIPDFDNLHSDDLELDGEVFICCLGTTIKKAGSQEAFKKVDKDYVVKFAELAEKRKVKKLIVVSAMGANKDSKIFYNRVKGEMEEEVSRLDIDEIQFFRPSLLIGDRAKSRPLEALGICAFKIAGVILPSALRSKIGTRVEDLVDEIILEIKNP